MKKLLAAVLAFALIFNCVPVGADAKAKVKLSKTKLTLVVGKTATLKLKNNRYKVKWRSTSKKIATVSKKGKVKAKKYGSCIIVAKAKKKSYRCRVTVKNPALSKVPSPTVDPLTKIPEGGGLVNKGNAKSWDDLVSANKITVTVEKDKDGYKKKFITKVSKDIQGALIIPKTINEIKKGVFTDCTGLTDIIVEQPTPEEVEYDEKLEFKGLTYIAEKAFEGCYSLVNVTLPDTTFYIGDSAFKNCSKLYNINFSPKLSHIGNSAFLNCISLRKVEFQGTIKEGYTSAFKGCTALTTVTFAEGTKEIEESAFSGCTSLANLTLPATLTTIYDAAFEDCKKLANISIPETVDYIGDRSFTGTAWLNSQKKKDKEVIVNTILVSLGTVGEPKSYTIPSSVTQISTGVFRKNLKIENVTIPSSVTTICQLAFEGCKNIKSLKVPSSVKKINFDAFKDVPVVYYSGPAKGKPWGAGRIA